MLFSATMPGPIVALARTFLDQPVQIRAEHDDASPATEHVDQFAYRAHAMDKIELLARILQARDRGLTMIFTRTKRQAAKVADDLIARGFAAAAVHGDLGQGAREQALRAFRSGKVDVLVATDVAARGLDVDGISHVINYQAPEDEKIYVHRIGRTARAGASGTAITLSTGRTSRAGSWSATRWACRSTSRPRPTRRPSTSTWSWTSRRTPARSCPGPRAPEPACRPSSSRTSAAPTPRDAGSGCRNEPERSERPARPARTRVRRRTRAGQPVEVSRDGRGRVRSRRSRRRRQRPAGPRLPHRTQRSRQQSAR